MTAPQQCSRAALEELKARLGEIYDLRRAAAVGVNVASFPIRKR